MHAGSFATNIMSAKTCTLYISLNHLWFQKGSLLDSAIEFLELVSYIDTHWQFQLPSGPYPCHNLPRRIHASLHIEGGVVKQPLVYKKPHFDHWTLPLPCSLDHGRRDKEAHPAHRASLSRSKHGFLSGSAQPYTDLTLHHSTTCLTIRTASNRLSTRQPQTSPCLPSSSRSSTSPRRSLMSGMQTSDMPTRRRWASLASSSRRSASLWS